MTPSHQIISQLLRVVANHPELHDFFFDLAELKKAHPFLFQENDLEKYQGEAFLKNLTPVFFKMAFSLGFTVEEIYTSRSQNVIAAKKAIAFVLSDYGVPDNVIAQLLHLDRTTLIYHILKKPHIRKWDDVNFCYNLLMDLPQLKQQIAHVIISPNVT